MKRTAFILASLIISAILPCSAAIAGSATTAAAPAAAKAAKAKSQAPASLITMKDGVIYCGSCKFTSLSDFQTCYTLPSEDITKGQKKSLELYADHRSGFELSDSGYYDKETQTTMTVSQTKSGIEITIKSALDSFSEYGISMPVNHMGKSNGGGWKNQYLLNNVFRSQDGKIMYAYMTNPNGNNVCILAKNSLAGWKEDYADNCHFFDKFNLYANFDRAFEPRTRDNEISFLIMSVKDYADLLDKVSKELDLPFLDVDRTGGKIGSTIKLIPHGKVDAVKVVNSLSGTEKTVPFKEEMEIEYESDTYLFPIRRTKGAEIIGGEAEIYGYTDILDTYRKTMNQVNLYNVFHFKDRAFDGNLCEHQCWAAAGLRYLQKYGDQMNADEKRRLTLKLNLLLDIITESDPELATPRVTILSSPQEKYPAYNILGLDRIQEEAFGMTILLDAYKYFGDQLYYDYLVNTMDSFLNTYQKENGALARLDGQDYSTVCCLIIPVIDVANFLKDKDKARSDRYFESARRLAWHICNRGLDFPTEGGSSNDPDEKEMEDGSISCSALSLLYYCHNVEVIPEFITKAKEILDVHESWVIQSSTCGSKCSTMRWWETCWEGDVNGPAICAGHAWTIWRAEADWLYYTLTGDEKYYTKAYNGFMTNFSKIRPDGKTFSIRNIDMLPGGGFTDDIDDVVFEVQKKFPEYHDCGLSRYVWIRANDSILESLK